MFKIHLKYKIFAPKRNMKTPKAFIQGNLKNPKAIIGTGPKRVEKPVTNTDF